MPRWLPRYPVYVLSKGRWNAGQTMKLFLRDEVPFTLVVEPAEADLYREAFPTVNIEVLPGSGEGSGLMARRWIREHSSDSARHWCIDDNIRETYYRYQGHRTPVSAGVALHAVEEFTDRYTNIGISGMNYKMFVPENRHFNPFFLNCHVYSILLINNQMPHNWRLRYNEDTDLCLQVLAGGLCTVAFNAFIADKIATMVMRGGNTDDLYRADGRTRMSRTLERQWPGVVETRHRFGRAQHHIKYTWKRFDTPLQRRADLDWDHIENNPIDYGLKLVAVKDEVKNERLRQMVAKDLDR